MCPARKNTTERILLFPVNREVQLSERLCWVAQKKSAHICMPYSTPHTIDIVSEFGELLPLTLIPEIGCDDCLELDSQV